MNFDKIIKFICNLKHHNMIVIQAELKYLAIEFSKLLTLSTFTQYAHILMQVESGERRVLI